VTTEYTVQGRNVFIGNKKDRPHPLDYLPVNTYVLNLDPEIGYFLSERDPFKLPPKIYGNTQSRAERFLNTFDSRSGTTGILLSGLKGSGKTMEMTLTCVQGLKLGYSTIVVNFAACGPSFNKFVQAINQPCIFILDEFEKVYDDKEQESLLTLLDGTYTSKKLFMLTCNDRYKVNSHMLNRPGRIFYSVRYGGLDAAFITDYCNDKLKDLTKMDSILRVAAILGDFNFDMLQALVEELNRYPQESVQQALELLNIDMTTASKAYYDIQYFFKGEEVKEERQMEMSPDSVSNPLLQDEHIMTLYDFSETGVKRYRTAKQAKSMGSNECLEVKFPIHGGNTIISKDISTIELVSDCGNWKAILKRPEPKTYTYGQFL
jgi:hypothetical protein